MDSAALYSKFCKDLVLSGFEVKREDKRNVGSEDEVINADLTVYSGQQLILALCLSSFDKIELIFEELNQGFPEAKCLAVFNGENFLLRKVPVEHVAEKDKDKFFQISGIPLIQTAKTQTKDYKGLLSMIKEIDLDKDQAVSGQECSNFLKKDLPKTSNMDAFFQSLEAEKDVMGFNDTECWLAYEFEMKFMSNLLGTVNDGTPLFRYMSAAGAKRIHDEEGYGMASIYSMNDLSETDYATKWLRDKKKIEISERDSQDSVLFFLSSFSLKEDDLTLWRLYGDDCKGVCLEFEAKYPSEQSFFYLLKVSYAQKDKHPILTYISKLLTRTFKKRRFVLKQWRIWQHFFKPHDYEVEDEVRLLFDGGMARWPYEELNKKWIVTSDKLIVPICSFPIEENQTKHTYPLPLKKVILGCKYPFAKANKELLNYYLQNDCKIPSSKEVEVEISKIDNYR